MKGIIICILLIITGCSFSPSNTSASLQKKPLIVCPEKDDCMGGDFRLSIVNLSESDTAKLYRVISVFDNKDLGLVISVPKAKVDSKGFGKNIILKSIGKESDNLLHFLAKLYKQKVCPDAKFVSSVSTSYVDLGEFVKSLSLHGSDEKLNTIEYKLFFETKDDEAELFLNINTEENWVELREKDPEFRTILIEVLTGR